MRHIDDLFHPEDIDPEVGLSGTLEDALLDIARNHAGLEATEQYKVRMQDRGHRGTVKNRGSWWRFAAVLSAPIAIIVGWWLSSRMGVTPRYVTEGGEAREADLGFLVVIPATYVVVSIVLGIVLPRVFGRRWKDGEWYDYAWPLAERTLNYRREQLECLAHFQNMSYGERIKYHRDWTARERAARAAEPPVPTPRYWQGDDWRHHD